MGSDYSHLRTVSYKDGHGRSATAVLELGKDGYAYLRESGSRRRTTVHKREVVDATDSELVDMLRLSLGLPFQFYKNGKSRRR